MHPDVLDAALEAVTRTDERLLADGQVPLASEAIQGGVKWQPEPPGDEHFDHAATVVQRGHGDCDDLAPYQAASLRHTGEDPAAKAVVIRSGPGRWHAVVERGDGSVEDPSAQAGMYEYHAPVQPKLAGVSGRAHIASRRIVQGCWAARVDAPWSGSRHALSGHGLGRSQSEAVANAIEGVVVVGDSAAVVRPETLAKLASFHALLHGENPDSVRRVLRHYGEGAAFGPLMRALRGMPVLRKLKTVRVPRSVSRYWTDAEDVQGFESVVGAFY